MQLVIWAVAIGCFLGAVFELVNGPDAADLLIRMLLGIAGSMVGSFVARAFGGLSTNHNAIGCIIGGSVLLFVYEILDYRQRRR